MKKAINILLFIFCSISLFAELPMGQWRTHISYANCTNVTTTNSTIYGLCSGALFSIDKEEESITTYSRLNGLNDNNIHLIAANGDLLIIAYSNSNIDLFYDESRVYNVADINRKTFAQSKKINSIFFYGNTAFLACDFGITALNINKKEITDTYFIGDNGEAAAIKNVLVEDDKIYALTHNSIKWAPIKGVNLLNYNNWNIINLPAENSRALTSYNGNLYLAAGENELFYLPLNAPENEWKKLDYKADSVWTSDNSLLLREQGHIHLINEQSDFTTPIECNDASYDWNENRLWYATSGGVYYIDFDNNEQNRFAADGPLDNSSWRIKSLEDRIYSVPGGRWAINYLYNGSVSTYNGYDWFNIDYSELKDKSPFGNCFDFVDIAIDPTDFKHFFVASYGLGLYEFRDLRFYKLYTYANSAIETLFPDDEKERDQYMRIDGLNFDANGNLWMLNRGNSQIKVMDKNGTIHPLQHSGITSAQTLQDIVINQRNNNLKLVLCPRYTSSENSLLFVFDDNGTPLNSNDDKTRSFTRIYDQDGKEISFATSFLRSIVQDKDGAIWVGTTQGPIVLNNLENIFSGDYRCTRIKIPREDGTNLADYLLTTEVINCIAIDGANRKWFGTETGAYLMSADGLTTIAHFTTQNSPLLSNSVISIGICEQTGEVFFGTSNGLISYRADAGEPSEKMETLRVFPNPVRPEFSGYVTITGLTADAYVRITDSAGHLVYDTKSNGGIATWDFRVAGKRVKAGVYFIHALSNNRKEHKIAKVLIL